MNSFRTIELSDSVYENGLRFLTIKTPNLKGRSHISLYQKWKKEQNNTVGFDWSNKRY